MRKSTTSKAKGKRTKVRTSETLHTPKFRLTWPYLENALGNHGRRVDPEFSVSMVFPREPGLTVHDVYDGITSTGVTGPATALGNAPRPDHNALRKMFGLKPLKKTLDPVPDYAELIHTLHTPYRGTYEGARAVGLSGNRGTFWNDKPVFEQVFEGHWHDASRYQRAWNRSDAFFAKLDDVRKQAAREMPVSVKPNYLETHAETYKGVPVDKALVKAVEFVIPEQRIACRQYAASGRRDDWMNLLTRIGLTWPQASILIDDCAPHGVREIRFRCSESRFVDFLIHRDALGLQNMMKEMKMRRVVVKRGKRPGAPGGDDLYTRIAKSTGVDRDKVKKVLLANGYSGAEPKPTRAEFYDTTWKGEEP